MADKTPSPGNANNVDGAAAANVATQGQREDDRFGSRGYPMDGGKSLRAQFITHLSVPIKLLCKKMDDNQFMALARRF